MGRTGSVVLGGVGWWSVWVGVRFEVGWLVVLGQRVVGVNAGWVGGCWVSSGGGDRTVGGWWVGVLVARGCQKAPNWVQNANSDCMDLKAPVV